MTYLILGVALFALVHLLPGANPGLKSGLKSRLGEGGYKGLFTLLALSSFGLIILGWRSTQPQLVYLPVAELKPLGLALVLFAFLLMVASALKSRIKLIVRHPQLTGVVIWAGAHLLLNGDTRSLILFSGFGLWALAEIFVINRREGAWVKDAPPSWGAEFGIVVATVITVAVVISIHPWIAGMPVF
ncbi:MAG: NnrU family protein [Halioglobus sp.]